MQLLTDCDENILVDQFYANLVKLLRLILAALTQRASSTYKNLVIHICEFTAVQVGYTPWSQSERFYRKKVLTIQFNVIIDYQLRFSNSKILKTYAEPI